MVAMVDDLTEDTGDIGAIVGVLITEDIDDITEGGIING